MKICILYSGGLDSIIMHHYAKVMYPDSEVILCYYDIGQEYNFKELAVLPKEVVVRKIDWLQPDTSLVAKENTQAIMIPGRNLALATLVACQELPDFIWMGALMGEIHDEATDKNFKFLEVLNETLKYVLAPYGKIPVVDFPLASAGFGKFEATKWYVDNGGNLDTLINSSSCLTKEHTDDCDNCGQCIVCLRRWGIFKQLGLKESYVHDPVAQMSDGNKKMVKEMMHGESGEQCHYDQYRRREIMPALYQYCKENNVQLTDLIA